MADLHLGEPCDCCGKTLFGVYYTCPLCKINICNWCATKQIIECKDIELIKSAKLPRCPMCGTKLKIP